MAGEGGGGGGGGAAAAPLAPQLVRLWLNEENKCVATQSLNYVLALIVSSSSFTALT